MDVLPMQGRYSHDIEPAIIASEQLHNLEEGWAPPLDHDL